MTRSELVDMLSAGDASSIEVIRREAEDVLLATRGSEVYCRGLIEFSNMCAADCLYCGIRHSNRNVNRYTLEPPRIVDCAMYCAVRGYGSVVLQSGERRAPDFIDMVVETVRRIKDATRSEALPDGLGITLSVGEQTPETYARFREAGAHRYLLRIETSNRELFARIHPAGQTFESRLACLRSLRELGFLVGTGVMIGLPGQTVDHLADDILFFLEHNIDMIGMGPFVPHQDTPLGMTRCPDGRERMRLSLLMIAATRLAMPEINIAATTALAAVDPRGQEKGISFGANVVMPMLTPAEVRADYLLYPGKPLLAGSARECLERLEMSVRASGRTMGYNQWGDSPRALQNALLR